MFSSIVVAYRVIFGLLRSSPNISEHNPTVLITVFNMADDIDAFNPFEDEKEDDSGKEEAVLPDVST